ncbi:unnamed protein product, partial [Pneumocystis jirovecii]
MPKDIDLSLNEKEFILEALNNNLRLDGRGFDVWRDLKLNFGNSYGHVELSLGKTSFIYLIFFRLSEEMTVSSIIDKAIRRSHMLDKESLCIIYGKQCWSIRADVHYLDHDGNLIDATSIAVVAALYHFKKPVVTVEGEKVIVHSIEERVPVPLILTHIPISITFSFFNENQISLMDTTLQEEKLREGSMVITLNKNKEICQISKVGGVILQTSHILKCLQLASKKALEITNYLNEKLKENEQSTNSIYDK